MAGKRRGALEAELAALSSVASDPRSVASRARLAEGLASRRAPVAARAARLVREHRVDGCERALGDAFARFFDESDPVCQAKLAAIEALDYAESADPAPFLRAVRHVQLEGGSDAAAPLRARAILALARIGHDDFLLVAARLVADPVPNVRQAALDALVHRGDRAGAALALCRLGVGDEPEVLLAAMSALLALAPDWGLPTLRDVLAGDDAARAELAAVALGQSRRDDALTLLVDALERCTRAGERAPLLAGIGLHRSDRALAALVAVIADGAPDDARAAVEALAARRFEPGVAERVQKAARANDRADLASIVAQCFRV